MSASSYAFMLWFPLSLISPILLTFVNHLDKFIIEKYFKESGVGAMIVFSSLSSILVFPIAFLIAGVEVFSLDFGSIACLVAVGVLSTIAVTAYLYALEDEEATLVVPFYQTVPLFALILAFVFLGETLSSLQLVGMAVIIIGSFHLSQAIEPDENGRLKLRPIMLILASAFILALNSILFKHIALQYSFWASIFWEYLGFFLYGAFVLVFFKKIRGDFVFVLRENTYRVLLLCVAGEIIALLAYLAIEYAVTLGPVALVLLADSYQPLFLLVWAIILMKLFPVLTKGIISREHFAKKTVAILIMVVGSVLISISDSTKHPAGGDSKESTDQTTRMRHEQDDAVTRPHQ